jgi:excisionase family DNA binding protein
MAETKSETRIQIEEPKMVYVDNQEIAEVFQIPVSTVDNLRRKGKLPAFKIGKHWRYDIKAIEKTLKGNNTN